MPLRWVSFGYVTPVGILRVCYTRGYLSGVCLSPVGISQVCVSHPWVIPGYVTPVGYSWVCNIRGLFRVIHTRGLFRVIHTRGLSDMYHPWVIRHVPPVGYSRDVLHPWVIPGMFSTRGFDRECYTRGFNPGMLHPWVIPKSVHPWVIPKSVHPWVSPWLMSHKPATESNAAQGPPVPARGEHEREGE